MLRRGPNLALLLLARRRRAIPPLLLGRRWKLRKARRRVQQNDCYQRRRADDVSHSPVHFRLFDPSVAFATSDLSLCLPCAL